jgi:hypothetical protein
MTRFTHFALFPALLLAACTSNSGKSVDLSQIPALSINATHAIDLDQSARGLSFVPNNVAPWLGRLILQNTDSSLSSTDIEGRPAQKVSNLDHSDTFGLARENQSGVFLAVNNKNNDLDAFIESDDQGNFTPLSYSGNSLSPNVFCLTGNAAQDSASLLTNDDKIVTLSLTIASGETAKSAPVEQEIEATLSAPVNTTLCAVTENDTLAYSRDGNKAYLHTAQDGHWKQINVPTSISTMVPLELNETNYLLLLDTENVFLFNIGTQKFEYRLVIESGLSIGGLDKTKFITASKYNYGGAAFSEGLVAFGQADEDRIVFVSRSYLADTVKGSNS